LSLSELPPDFILINFEQDRENEKNWENPKRRAVVSEYVNFRVE
jgi:hypothetical protein